jgi:acetyltransferase-like isoleucine patch superfamily enzyme
MKRILVSLIVKVYKKVLLIVEGQEWRVLKSSFKSIGEKCYIPNPRRIINPQFVEIGNDFNSLYNMRIEAIDSYYGDVFSPEIIIGDNVSFNSDCHIGCIDKIHIGNNVLVASRVYISDHLHGEVNADALKLPPALRPLYSRGPVKIEDNVWIGEGVCILPGVTIGANSIIGANSVVTKSIPANSVAAGVPAQIIRKLV